MTLNLLGKLVCRALPATVDKFSLTGHDHALFVQKRCVFWAKYWCTPHYIICVCFQVLISFHLSALHFCEISVITYWARSSAATRSKPGGLQLILYEFGCSKSSLLFPSLSAQPKLVFLLLFQVQKVYRGGQSNTNTCQSNGIQYDSKQIKTSSLMVIRYHFFCVKDVLI